MTIRKLVLGVAIALTCLAAGRIAGLFLPPVVALWLWRVLLAPFVLVGAVVALLLLVTTVLCLGRIRYLVDAAIAQEKTALVEIRYLMGLVHFVLTYENGETHTRTRIAWMKLGQEKPQKKKKKKKRKNPAPKESTLPAESPPDTVKTSAPNEPSEDPPEKEKSNPLKQAKAILTYPDRKIIIALCFQCLQKFVRALKPKRLDIHGIVGFDDPATTGWFMGAYEAAVAIMQLRHKVRLLGNYMEKALELNIQAQGRTRVWGLIWPFVWLYLHKPIRVVIHEHIMRKDDENE